MRLFAALLPPEEAAHQLSSRILALRTRPGADTLRWTGRSGWHFTLAFMGEVDEALIPALQSCLARTAGDHGPFPLRLAGGGNFGGRALWAGTAGDLGALNRLAADTKAAAQEAGILVEADRPYVPHLTIALSRDPVDLRPYARALKGFESAPWTVRELVLVRSDAESRYQVVGTWPLGADT